MPIISEFKFLKLFLINNAVQWAELKMKHNRHQTFQFVINY